MKLEQILSNTMKKMISGYSIEEDREGMSPAKVFKLVNDNDILYLKLSHKVFKGTTYDVKREKDIILWLQGKINVPKVIYFEENNDYDFLLMSKVEGKSLSSNDKKISPETIVRTYVEGIREVQSIDISECPFSSDASYRLSELEYLFQHNLAAEDDFYEGDSQFSTPGELIHYLKNNVPAEEFVFSHGDMCGGNMMVKNHKLIGLIDWGRGGMADKWYDIAFCVRNIKEDLGSERYVELFFELLDITPDWDKINYYILLDELF